METSGVRFHPEGILLTMPSFRYRLTFRSQHGHHIDILLKKSCNSDWYRSIRVIARRRHLPHCLPQIASTNRVCMDDSSTRLHHSRHFDHSRCRQPSPCAAGEVTCSARSQGLPHPSLQSAGCRLFLRLHGIVYAVLLRSDLRNSTTHHR